jgi:hypothetical protein
MVQILAKVIFLSINFVCYFYHAFIEGLKIEVVHKHQLLLFFIVKKKITHCTSLLAEEKYYILYIIFMILFKNLRIFI